MALCHVKVQLHIHPESFQLSWKRCIHENLNCSIRCLSLQSNSVWSRDVLQWSQLMFLESDLHAFSWCSVVTGSVAGQMICVWAQSRSRAVRMWRYSWGKCAAMSEFRGQKQLLGFLECSIRRVLGFWCWRQSQSSSPSKWNAGVKYSVLKLGPSCLEFFQVTFPFLGSNNLEIPDELGCKQYSLINSQGIHKD